MKAQPCTLLVADDDPIVRQVISYGFTSSGLRAEIFESGDALLDQINDRVEACVLDIQMPGTDGLTCLKQIKEAFPYIEVIILTNLNQAGEALEAVRHGAFDYLTKPFDIKELNNRVTNAMALSRSQRERDVLKSSFSEPKLSTFNLGDSTAMKQVASLVAKIAPTNNAVLLTGESGTGKTLLARSVHSMSKRVDAPFVSVSCPSLPGELLESEMFGHEKGAFTGATSRRSGRVELAEGGTLFLDEIGELSMGLQTKLLTFLQEKTYYRLGGEKAFESDVRIIAATNQNLEVRVKEGAFREDLFYRLNVLPIVMPRLAHRSEDIPMLVHHFVKRFALENDQPLPDIEPEFLYCMQSMSWPGNVRELENYVIRAMTLRADPESLSKEDVVSSHSVNPDTPVVERLGGRTLVDIEKDAIMQTLELCSQRKAEAAKLLGIAEKTIYNKMRRHGLIED